MSLIDTITGLFSRNAKKYMYAPIDFSHVQNAIYSVEPLESGKNYFRVWLSEMCLAKDRDWFKSWYPAVHSIISIQFGNQEVNLPYVAGSLNLSDVNSNNLDKVIQLNHPMTALMPFNGGVVELTAGLLAMQGQDNLNKFIKVMGDFANILVVPQLSAAISVAGPIAKGIEELLGASNGDLHLGLHQAFVGKGGGNTNLLKAGYIAVILAQETELDANNLWVISDSLHFGADANSSKPLTGRTYMLFKIENREERDDLDGLTNIRGPFDQAINALTGGDEDRANTLLKVSLGAAMTSADLTKADRIRVAQALKEEFDNFKNNMPKLREQARLEGRENVEFPEFSKVLKLKMPVDEALALGEPTLEKILGKPK